MLESKLKIIILFMSMLYAETLSAQQPDEAAKRELEREIKVSGNYLYGEAIGNTKDEAVKMAKTALASEINKEALNHPEWQFAKQIKATDVEYNVDMIDLMRGNKFRVIAYLKKENIQAVFENKKQPAVKIEDRKEKKVETPAVIQPQTPQQEPEMPVTPASVTLETEETKAPAPEKPQPTPDSMKNTGDLLGQILKASSMLEVQKLLKENKMKGKVAYGTMDKLTAPEKAYLIVYKKTGEIVAILDKGSVVSRKDLLSGEIKANTIIEQNQVIWFQLF